MLVNTRGEISTAPFPTCDVEAPRSQWQKKKQESRSKHHGGRLCRLWLLRSDPDRWQVSEVAAVTQERILTLAVFVPLTHDAVVFIKSAIQNRPLFGCGTVRLPWIASTTALRVVNAGCVVAERWQNGGRLATASCSIICGAANRFGVFWLPVVLLKGCNRPVFGCHLCCNHRFKTVATLEVAGFMA